MEYLEFVREHCKISEFLINTVHAGCVDDMIISLGIMDEHEMLELCARFASCRVIDLDREPCDRSLLNPDIVDECLKYSLLPWRTENNSITYATWKIPNESFYEHSLGRSKIVLAHKKQVLSALQSAYSDVLSKKISNKITINGKYNTSAQSFSPATLAIFFIFCIACLLLTPGIFVYTALAISSISSSLSSLFNLYISYLFIKNTNNTAKYPDSTNDNLPIYTIILPLYKETVMLDQLIRAVRALDYPQWKLDIKIVIEADDAGMLTAVEAMNLPRIFELLIVPSCQPKTKAKACNYAMLFARGEYITIFDAEDIPDTDQLRKAVNMFAYNANVQCLQCELEIYNKNTNLLTAMFYMEYKMWHNIRLRASYGANLPSPLCGSSNHIRTDFLRQIGCWDAYNVTEDAELGIRSHIYGGQTMQLNSITLEEAPHTLAVWHAQRTRWFKGLIISYLALMRHPQMMLSKLGYFNMLNLTATFFLNQFVIPVFGLFAIIGMPFVYRGDGVMLYCYLVPLTISIIISYAHILILSKLQKSYKAIILGPMYIAYSYILMPTVAITACWQLLSSPYKWAKTIHTIKHMTEQKSVAKSP